MQILQSGCEFVNILDQIGQVK